MNRLRRFVLHPDLPGDTADELTLVLRRMAKKIVWRSLGVVAARRASREYQVRYADAKGRSSEREVEPESGAQIAPIRLIERIRKECGEELDRIRDDVDTLQLEEAFRQSLEQYRERVARRVEEPDVVRGRENRSLDGLEDERDQL